MTDLYYFDIISHFFNWLHKENQPYIFVVQKLTDMVPTKNIYRAWPPVGDGTEAGWED
jgi:hypothetical protein